MEKYKRGLAANHWVKRKAAKKAVEEMLHNPLTPDQMEAQIARLEAQQDANALQEYEAWVAAGRPNDRHWHEDREEAHLLIEGIKKIISQLPGDEEA